MDETEKVKINQTLALYGDALQNAHGQLLGLQCAVAALVQTHPDGAAFAAAFRRAWQQSGQQNANYEHAPQTLGGIERVLSMLEESLPVPLDVRPPDVARSPRG